MYFMFRRPIHPYSYNNIWTWSSWLCLDVNFVEKYENWFDLKDVKLNEFIPSYYLIEVTTFYIFSHLHDVN